MENKVQLVFWDVQHGLATYIKTPNNRNVVIDLGTGDYSGDDLTFSPLQHLRRFYNVEIVDYLVVTHPHLDHIDDILNLNSIKVFHRPSHLTNELVLSGVRQQDKPKYDKYCLLNTLFTGPISGGVDDPAITRNYGGMRMQFFYTPTCSQDNFNNHSIVTVIEFAGIKIVIPGDNESASFDLLMQDPLFVSAVENSQILLAPHHGRLSGYHSAFVNLVNPYLTVVSDGKIVDTSANNRYSQKSQGWPVHKKDGSSSTRRCLSTNSDGQVYISFGLNDEQIKFINVRIE